MLNKKMISLAMTVFVVLFTVQCGGGGGGSSSSGGGGSSAPTNLTYSVPSPTYTIDLTITENVPAVIGTVTSWTIASGSMPSGLHLESDGRITGTPDTLQSATNVTIRATNSDGYTECTISITVNYAAPFGLTYASMSPTYTKDTVITENMPSVTGTVTSWMDYSGTLPSGLTLESDGRITGTPTSLQLATDVTIRAINSGGYTECIISITVNDLAPTGLTYTSASPTYTKDAVITENVPTVTGTVTSWTVSSGSMPSGLNLGSDGKITGTPISTQSATNITIRADNSGGYTECTISITVNYAAPAGLTYASNPATYTKDLVISYNSPTVTGTVTSWTVSSGTLPDGLNIDGIGRIYGTPTSIQSATNVTIRATNSGGYTECTISITVNDIAPTGLTYASMSPTYTKDAVITANVPTVTGTVTSWSIYSGSMPAGLNLGSDGKITGTPTAIQSATNVTIRADNSGGYTDCAISITVNYAAPSGLTYASMSPTYTKDTVITANIPAVTGTVTSWSIYSGSLPAGLNLGSDGRITGTPTVLQLATDVTIRATNSGGSINCTLSITVNEQAPSGLTYASMSPTYTKDLVITSNVPTVTGTVVTWSVSSGTLPAGLNLGSDGRITGTPTALQTATDVIIRASNSGGYTECTISITVNDVAPSGLTYASMSPTYTKDAVITANVPTVTGTIISWSIYSGSMPAGLNLGSDGRITGTPTSIQSATNITIRATNSGGYTDCTISITVNYAAPSGFTYANMTPTYTVGSVITDNVPTITGSGIIYSVYSGTMATGLSLNASTGHIYGTPSTEQAATNVIIRATNSGGYTDCTLSITVNYAAPSGFTYASMSPTYTVGSVITDNVPTVTGSGIIYSIYSGTMATGLSLNASTGYIYGTPSIEQAATNITIRATNSGGYTDCTVSVTVNYAAPSGFTYANMTPTYTVGSVITDNVPTITGSGIIYSVYSGTMATGLSLNASTGYIYGTPSAEQAATNVIIRATNSGGYTDCTISITVNYAAPSGFTYANMTPTYTVGSVITDNVPTVTGSGIIYSIYSGTMATGLSLNASTGYIYGTPSAEQAATNVIIRATNSGGYTDCTISITVNYAAPCGLTYAEMSPTYTKDAVITANVPSVTGTITSWSISSGSLPAGLNLGSDGRITGTPAALQSATNVTIRATNSGGFTECTISIVVNDAAPTNLTYSSNPATYTKDAVITANVPSVTGTITSWSISSGSLPAGLNLGSDGRITGTPAALQIATDVTVRATNSGGYAECVISITVNDEAPTNLTYLTNPATYTINLVITPNLRTVTGTVTSWSVSSGSLPAGLNLGSDGRITGTPAALQSATNVTIRAANSGGYTECVVSITVNDVAPSGLTYTDMTPKYAPNFAIPANTPNVTGTVTSWTVSGGTMPAGLTLGGTGNITGIPTAVQSAANVTIRAANSGGYTECTISITVRIPGSIWTAQTLPSSTTWSSIAYGNGRFVAVAGGTAASTVAGYSTDGVTWIATGALPSARWSSVTYGNGYFVAVSGNSTTSQTTAYLADGSTMWTTGGNLPSARNWTSVAYGNISGTDYFVAIAGYTTSGTFGAYSTNHGQSWTATGALTNAVWASVTFGNGRFVAVSGNTGNSNVSMYTTNGTIWTAMTGLANGRWASVIYGNGRFVAVSGFNSARNVTAYSTNGTSWTTGGTTPTSQRWRSVAYGNNYFVAVSGYTGSLSTVTSYSTDGSTWTTGGAITSGIWSSICYGTINTGFATVASTSLNGATTP